MSTQYRLVQSGKTASGGCSAGQGSSEPVAPRIYYYLLFSFNHSNTADIRTSVVDAMDSCFARIELKPNRKCFIVTESGNLRAVGPNGF
jgi:hypothetical protein